MYESFFFFFCNSITWSNFQLTNYQIPSCLLRRCPLYGRQSAVRHLEMCKGVLSSHNDWHFVGKNQRIMTAVLEKVPYKEVSCLKCQSILIKEHWNTSWGKKRLIFCGSDQGCRYEARYLGPRCVPPIPKHIHILQHSWRLLWKETWNTCIRRCQDLDWLVGNGLPSSPDPQKHFQNIIKTRKPGLVLFSIHLAFIHWFLSSPVR